MKLVTFNIRCDYGQDKENNFVCRRELILKKIKEEQPDLICFQEVLPHVAAWLKDSLDAYYVIGCGRSDTLRDEQVAVAYRKDRMNLIAMETFWLSETPEAPGSRYREQSICPRTCTEAVFEDLEEQKVFRLVNTHLDHEGAQARKLGLGQILEKLENEVYFSQAPAIIAGDFNATPDDEEMQVILKEPGYQNATAGVGETFHDFGRNGMEQQIDYVFLKGCTCSGVEKWTEKEGDVYLSDHYPVCVQIEL